jgi:hypothetical protein
MKKEKRIQTLSRNAVSALHQRALSESISCAQHANKPSTAVLIARNTIGQRNIRMNARNYRRICLRSSDLVFHSF